MADAFDKTLAELQTLKDELKLKAHLAGKDLQDFADQQQVKLDELTQRFEGAKAELEGRAPELKETAKRLLDEVKGAFAATRARLKRD